VDLWDLFTVIAASGKQSLFPQYHAARNTPSAVRELHIVKRFSHIKRIQRTLGLVRSFRTSGSIGMLTNVLFFADLEYFQSTRENILEYVANVRWLSPLRQLCNIDIPCIGRLRNKSRVEAFLDPDNPHHN
jgi:hypothetical protein